MAESTGIEALDKYRNISKKLKKTFFKKPNETEALESYIALAHEFENSELHVYSGLCWNAAAKCENALGNLIGEITSLLRCARQYAIAEKINVKIGCVNFGDDYLQASLNAYNLAASKYEKKSPLLTTLYLEIVEFLKLVGRNEYIEDYLKYALESCSDGEFMKIHCSNLLASNFIRNGDYFTALNTFTEISNFVEKLPDNGANADVLLNCEICKVFLLLILKPSPQKLTPEWTNILERYTWSDRDDDNLKTYKMTEEMFLLLETLVTTCQSVDTSCLIHLEGKLWPLLTTEQKNLLRILVQLHCS